MDQRIMEVPEVKSVLGKMGRADTATDPAPLGMAETTIVLKPKAQWREGMTWEDIVAELDSKLQFPGMPNIWWMPIQTRTEMLTTGIRSEHRKGTIRNRGNPFRLCRTGHRWILFRL
jgi:Cu(I)/Ag(I) efflux system membrane protein CusA/SilA